MAAKSTILDAATVLYANDVIDEQDFVCIYENTRRRNPEFQYWNFEKVHNQLGEMTTDESKAEFRFELADLPLLAEALKIPDKIVCPNRTVATGMEALCITLKRFAYPCRYNDMIPRCGRSVSELCLITSEVTNHIFDTHGYLLRDLDQPWLQPNHLEKFANAIHSRGAALQNCWGFVDGTVRPICRPGEHERLVYNGHKRVHAIKFQSVVAPNGLVANLYGPTGKLIF